MSARNLIENLIIDYLTQTTKEVKKIAAEGKGREILDEVENRPEDIEIGIDRVGEEILEKLLERCNLKAAVFSELKTIIENEKMWSC